MTVRLHLLNMLDGSIENFVNMMNDKAKELSLENTHFVTPHGLDDDEHFTTAYELACLTDYALNNEKFAQIVNTKTCIINVNGINRSISNTNELLGNLNGVNGVKTGFTGNAMRCLVTSCTRDNHQIITIVLGADTKKLRTIDSIKLIEYGFTNFERVNLEEIIKNEYEKWKTINENRIYINKKEDKDVKLELGKIKNKIIPLELGLKDNIVVDFNCLYQFEAPIKQGTKIGNIFVKANNEILESVDIFIENNIEKKNVFSYFMQILKEYPLCFKL